MVDMKKTYNIDILKDTKNIPCKYRKIVKKKFDNLIQKIRGSRNV